MVWRAKSFWLALGAAAYAGFASHSSGGGTPAAIALLLAPLVLAFGWRSSEPPIRGEDRIDPGARSAARGFWAGSVLLLVTTTAPNTPGFVALSNAGAGLAVLSGLVALSRLESLGGVLATPSGARRLDAAAFAAMLWTVAMALPIAQALLPDRTAALDPLLGAYATSAAAVGSLLVTLVAAIRTRVERRLELGVGERAGAAILLSIVCLVTGAACSVLQVLPPERMMPLAAAIAAGAAALSAVAMEATSAARFLRATLILSLTAIPAGLFAVYAAQAWPTIAAAAIFGATLVAAIAGYFTLTLTRAFSGDAGQWLEAFEAATEAAMNPDPDQALENALARLRRSSGKRFLTPSLYRIGPSDVVTVDRAGFVHTTPADLPPRLIDLAIEEPEHVVRLEVLKAVEVRRPDVRALRDWLRDRNIAAGALISDTSGPIGMLAIARHPTQAPLSLEEVRALRRLSDRIGAVLGVGASLERSRKRELSAHADVELLETEVANLTAERDFDALRLDLVAETLARPARTAVFSPAATTVTQELERLANHPQPITLISQPGVDAVAWAAVAHLASPHRGKVMLVLEGTHRLAQSLAHWREKTTSPITAAKGGTLVIVDPHALPVPVQRYLANALPPDVGVIVVLPSTVDALVGRGVLEETFADRLGDRAVVLPTLIDRGEDLRPLAFDILTHLGLRLRGAPLGISPEGLALLGEHDWPGNDAELFAVLVRAARVAQGDSVGKRELALAGFAPSIEPNPMPAARSVGPIPIPRRRGRRPKSHL